MVGIAPGITLADPERAGSTEINRLLEMHRRRTPLRRLAAVEEIAEASLFLASEEASFLTGQVLLADGGVSLSLT